PEPARYRRSGPIWADETLPDLARVTKTKAMLCAVRSASLGTDGSSNASAPYGEGKWLFSLNGKLFGWSDAAANSHLGRRVPDAGASAETTAAVLKLAESLPATDLLGLQARCDTALIWALVRRRLRAGEEPAAALAGTVTEIESVGGAGRFNLLLTDGE